MSAGKRVARCRCRRFRSDLQPRILLPRAIDARDILDELRHHRCTREAQPHPLPGALVDAPVKYDDNDNRQRPGGKFRNEEQQAVDEVRRFRPEVLQKQ